MPLALVPDPPPRRARKREARLATEPAEEELEEVSPFSMSTPPMNPQALSSTPSSARKMRFPPAPFPPAPSRRRRGRRGSSSSSSGHLSCSSIGSWASVSGAWTAVSWMAAACSGTPAPAVGSMVDSSWDMTGSSLGVSLLKTQRFDRSEAGGAGSGVGAEEQAREGGRAEGEED